MAVASLAVDVRYGRVVEGRRVHVRVPLRRGAPPACTFIQFLLRAYSLLPGFVPRSRRSR
jgi:hypothetical protein